MPRSTRVGVAVLVALMTGGVFGAAFATPGGSALLGFLGFLGLVVTIGLVSGIKD